MKRATGGDGAAAIGSGKNQRSIDSAGKITIAGNCQLKANGGSKAAGIGAGYNSIRSVNVNPMIYTSILIKDTAKVTAYGGTGAAAIGCSAPGDSANLNQIGSISIQGGTVESGKISSLSDENGGPAIGGVSSGGSTGDENTPGGSSGGSTGGSGLPNTDSSDDRGYLLMIFALSTLGAAVSFYAGKKE